VRGRRAGRRSTDDERQETSGCTGSQDFDEAQRAVDGRYVGLDRRNETNGHLFALERIDAEEAGFRRQVIQCYLRYPPLHTRKENQQDEE